MVADKVRGIYDEEGKEKRKRKPKDSVVANLPQQTNDKKSRDKAAEAVGVSGKLADAAMPVLLSRPASGEWSRRYFDRSADRAAS